jgi:energy-converting hydrogenase Eha subunit C
MCYAISICVLTFVCGFYLLLGHFQKKHAYIFADGLKCCMGSYFFLARTNFIRFILGAIHAILYNNPTMQIQSLLAFQVVQFIMIIIARRCFLLKTTFWISIIAALVKIVLHIILVLEASFEGLVSSYDAVMS